MRNETGTVFDSALTNYEKGAWYISILPLPEEVKSLPIVRDDLKYSAAIQAMWERPMGKFLK